MDQASLVFASSLSSVLALRAVHEALLKEPHTHESEEVLSSLTTVFLIQKKAAMLLNFAVVEELEANGPDSNTLFRSNNCNDRIISQILNAFSEHFLKKFLRALLSKISDKHDYEVNPAQFLGKPMPDICERSTKLLNAVQLTLDFITTLLMEVDELKGACFRICEEVEHRFPGQGVRRIGALVFLRVICPALINTKKHGISMELTPRVQRALLLIAKLLQSLACNQVPNEAYLQPIYEAGKHLRSSMEKLFRVLVTPISSTAEEVPYACPSSLKPKTVLPIAAFIHKNFFTIRTSGRAFVATQDWLGSITPLIETIVGSPVTLMVTTPRANSISPEKSGEIQRSDSNCSTDSGSDPEERILDDLLYETAPEKWSLAEVQLWLCQVHLSHLIHPLPGNELFTASEDDLAKLVPSIGIRKRLSRYMTAAVKNHLALHQKSNSVTTQQEADEKKISKKKHEVKEQAGRKKLVEAM